MKIMKYDLEIYPLEIIQQAAIDYSQIARISVLKRKGSTICYFFHSKANEEKTVLEFSNYLIDLIGSR